MQMFSESLRGDATLETNFLFDLMKKVNWIVDLHLSLPERQRALVQNSNQMLLEFFLPLFLSQGEEKRNVKWLISSFSQCVCVEFLLSSFFCSTVK